VGPALVAGGGYSLATALALAGVGGTYPFVYRLGAGILGGIVVMAEAWVLWRAQRSAVVVDRGSRTVTLIRRGLFRTTSVDYPATAVADVRVTKERDGRGAPVYRVELVLDTGSVVPVPLFRRHDRKRCMRTAERLWVALGLPRA
jgi:hypothetical protein